MKILPSLDKEKSGVVLGIYLSMVLITPPIMLSPIQYTDDRIYDYDLHPTPVNCNCHHRTFPAWSCWHLIVDVNVK